MRLCMSISSLHCSVPLQCKTFYPKPSCCGLEQGQPLTLASFQTEHRHLQCFPLSAANVLLFTVELFSLLDQRKVKHNTAHLGMLEQCLLKRSHLIPVYRIPHALFDFHQCLQILMSLDLLSIHEVNGILGGNEVIQKQLWIKRITGIFHVHKCLQPSWRGSKASACKQQNLFI